MLEDVERIEVIRGPGGTIWGANAVTGVINIITKSAKDTHGALASIGGGNIDQGIGGVRYGSGNGNFDYRIYGKGFSRGAGFHSDDQRYDTWRSAQMGFRTDWDVRAQRPSHHTRRYVQRWGRRARGLRIVHPARTLSRIKQRRFQEAICWHGGGTTCGKGLTSRFRPTTTAPMPWRLTTRRRATPSTWTLFTI